MDSMLWIADSKSARVGIVVVVVVAETGAMVKGKHRQLLIKIAHKNNSFFTDSSSLIKFILASGKINGKQ